MPFVEHIAANNLNVSDHVYLLLQVVVDMNIFEIEEKFKIIAIVSFICPEYYSLMKNLF